MLLQIGKAAGVLWQNAAFFRRSCNLKTCASAYDAARAPSGDGTVMDVFLSRAITPADPTGLKGTGSCFSGNFGLITSKNLNRTFQAKLRISF